MYVLNIMRVCLKYHSCFRHCLCCIISCTYVVYKHARANLCMYVCIYVCMYVCRYISILLRIISSFLLCTCYIISHTCARASVHVWSSHAYVWSSWKTCMFLLETCFLLYTCNIEKANRHPSTMMIWILFLFVVYMQTLLVLTGTQARILFLFVYMQILLVLTGTQAQWWHG